MPVVTYSIEVSSHTQLNTWETGSQLAPDIHGLANGGFVVAYNNDTSVFGHNYILLDFYDANGFSLGLYSIPYADFDATNPNGAPSITQLTNGNVLVVWDDDHATTPGLVGAIFSDTGALVTAEFNLTGITSDIVPQVTALTGGGFAIAWEFAGDIGLATFSASGTPISGEVFDVLGAEPAIAGLANGNFAVAWTAGFEIHAAIYDANGDVVVGEFAAGQVGDQNQPAIAATPDGGFVLAYPDSGWNGESEITVTRYGSAGNFLGHTFVTAEIAGDLHDNYQADVAVLDNGFIVVSWGHQFNPGVDEDIFFSILDQDGNLISVAGQEVFIADQTTSNDVLPTVTALLSGNFQIAWQDSQTDGDGGQINSVHGQLVRNTVGDGTSETIFGDELRDVIDAGGGADTLHGGDGDDALNGGAGADTMFGGNGDDGYFVDNAGDVTSEVSALGGNNDTVFSSVTRNLSANIENLVLTGAAAIAGAGNALNNIITGNSAANTIHGFDGSDRLDGGAGADAMFGGNGQDFYFVDNSGDVTSEVSALGGVDLVFSSVSRNLSAHLEHLTLSGGAAITGAGNGLNNNITGNGAANTLYGFDGNDVLNGSVGADTMFGANGDDTYVVDDVNDITVEGSALGGVDFVISFIDRNLNANFEHLQLAGSAQFAYGNVLNNELIGNAAANSLYGFDGNDTLVGEGGADQMFGGNGNDAYWVDNSGDVTSEVSALGGTDSVFSSVTRNLTAHLENLTLIGAADITGAGNALNNFIIGNTGANTLFGLDGADTLNGGLGADTLQGGAHADTYVFTSELGGGNVDTIVNFSAADDTIVLDNDVFAGLPVGALNADAFHIGAAAADAEDRIIYNSATGALHFDADGTGLITAVQFATLAAGLALTSSDFIIGD